MNRLKELRQLNNISQKDLAKLLNKAESTISMWENGQREMDYETLKDVANYFQVSIDYLLGKSDVRNISDDRLDDIDLSAFPVGFLGELSEMSKEQIEQLRTYARFLKQRNDDDD